MISHRIFEEYQTLFNGFLGLRISNRSIFFLLLVAISFSPFYLPLKYTILYGTNYWALNGYIVIFLFSLLFAHKVTKKNMNINSSIDLWMVILIIYFTWLCFLAILLGSDLHNIFSRFWLYVVGIMVYFITMETLNTIRIKTIENLLCALSFVVAIIFLIEWALVNVLGLTSFPWSIAMHERGTLNAYFISYGGASLTWNEITRVGGPLGSYQNSSLFIALGTIFFFFRIILFGANLRILFMFFICSIGLLFSASRFVVVATVISIANAYLLLGTSNKMRLLRFASFCLFIIAVGFFFANEDIKIMLSTFYYEKLIIDNFKGGSIGGSLLHLLSNFKSYGEYISNYPLFFFTGSGFGHFSAEDNFVFGSGDVGWLSFAGQIGIFGIVIISIIIFHLIRISNNILKDRNIDGYLQYLAVSSLSFILTAIIATFHAGAIFHVANYYSFFALIGVISYIDHYCASSKYRYTPLK